MALSGDGEAGGILRQLDEVTGALAALTAALDDDGELDTSLQLVCRQLIHVIPGADLASITLLRNGVPSTAACTDHRAFDLDAVQYRAGSGPCLEAAETRRVVRVDVATARGRWPEFTRRALDAGVASYLSAPLAVDAAHTGSLNLYGLHAHGYQEVEGTLLELFVAAVEGALRSTARYLAARREAGQLSTALVSRAAIDQAKGILMGARGISADEAFRLLVVQSQRENVKLRDCAERLVTAVLQGTSITRRPGRPGACPR
ncbi:ANTAR domain-containing protein [Amycolatopsis sp. NPDC051045]|uniref:ANTAR domain-containing protein n=1 Tax=Amycolatopsis sp. NPDC051045 TaxID=3156922 RepID=UPI0034423CDA